ncbi:hypothetical protein TI39_contig592g00010 [Zymoseptoria brevis]|uniref:CsbD-like domain-containing protein n=1 Tax=Zymoseptoria brevis TaxID=1047168 RepID=A0A0F4GIA9_9PEZI|nr:hypothetical protein TI39_contig592g00010 [Zymoseptoria brevis]
MSANDNTTQPSLVGGHAEYVKGVVEGTVGTLTGSKAWQDSAAKDKQAGIDDMKAASANRDPTQSGLGKVEEVAGKAVGCEGMEKEGAQSKTQ